MDKNVKTRKTMSYEKKKSLYGYGFISLWIVGFLLFFVRPLFLVVAYSFSKIEYPDSGGYNLIFRGVTNYSRAFLEDPDILRMLYTSVSSMVLNAPVIIILSIAIAVVLNKKFAGRTVVRAIFFVPVIVAGGLVVSILNGDIMARTMLAGQKSSSMLQVSGLRNILMEFGLPQQVISYITNIANNIFNLLWKSGIQILLFLASLQTIPPSLYEASSIEGATEWDNFWKITIPMISPMVLTAVIYTVVDSFVDYGNLFMQKINMLTTTFNVEYSSTLSLLYFGVIMIIIGVIYYFARKLVFYRVDY